MKNLFSCLILVFTFSFGLQGQLNDYKYIIVPKSFKGFKVENQHKTSTLLKHLFTKEGFETYYDDDLPSDLNTNRCLGLWVQLNHKSSMFATRASITLMDCNSKDVYTSPEGTSKEKDFGLSYKEAIEISFASISALDYAYNPVQSSSAATKTAMPQMEVKSSQPAPKEHQAAVLVEASNVNSEKVINPKTEAVKNSEFTVPVKEQSPAPVEEQISNSEKVVNTKTETAENAVAEAVALNPIAETSESSQVWYAQQISNGYQLVDSTPKIRMKIYDTSVPEVYIGVREDGTGIVYKRGSQWYFEYYMSDKLQTEELAIKF